MNDVIEQAMSELQQDVEIGEKSTDGVVLVDVDLLRIAVQELVRLRAMEGRAIASAEHGHDLEKVAALEILGR